VEESKPVATNGDADDDDLDSNDYGEESKPAGKEAQLLS
jgi:hypothetical protein